MVKQLRYWKMRKGTLVQSRPFSSSWLLSVNFNAEVSLDNLTPADVYFGRGQAILNQREDIKRQTIQNRRLAFGRFAA